MLKDDLAKIGNDVEIVVCVILEITKRTINVAEDFERKAILVQLCNCAPKQIV